MRIEEKLTRKQKNTRRTPRYGRGKQKEKQVEDSESSYVAAKETVGKGVYADRGRGRMTRGIRRGGKPEIFCFECGVAGHKAWEC